MLSCNCLQAFVAKVGRNVYCFRDAWEQPASRRAIRDGVTNNPQLGSSIYSSQLPLDAKSLQPVLLNAVTAFVDSYKVRLIRALTAGSLFCEAFKTPSQACSIVYHD